MTRLRIVLSELPESVIKEVVAYTWNQYLADIGGASKGFLVKLIFNIIWKKEPNF